MSWFKKPVSAYPDPGEAKTKEGFVRLYGPVKWICTYSNRTERWHWERPYPSQHTMTVDFDPDGAMLSWWGNLDKVKL